MSHGYLTAEFTLVDLLRRRAEEHPDKRAYTFLNSDGVAEGALSYRELDERAQSAAARLQETVAAGERVLLLFPPGLDYISAFFGCLYAGVIAVPAYPPSRRQGSMARIVSIAMDCQPAAVLTTASILNRFSADLRESGSLAQVQWLALDAPGASMHEAWRRPDVRGDSIAFLQYTSGSTSHPKGVMLTHHNLLHNEESIQKMFRQDEQSIIVGWLPLYHDMGLIGNVIQPLYSGAACVLMSPMTFLQKPFRWLEAISNYRATTSGGPNFSYDLCVRRISAEERASLDLRSWRVAFNGAEPIRSDTLDRFAGAFESRGFDRKSFHACYGLAEASLLVAGAREPLIKRVAAKALERNRVIAASSDDPSNSRVLVGCGDVLCGDNLVIVDPGTSERCQTGRVGEIWFSGRGVALGYWNRSEESASAFGARLDGDNEGRFLRTGDLGFIDEDCLFITGRLKDLIIIRGLNYYPQDIELSVEQSHPALRPGCGVAFSIDDAEGEMLAAVQEVERRFQDCEAAEVFAAIREAVARDHQLQLHAIILVKAGSIPKTSSGKLQRNACKLAYFENALDAVARWQSDGANDSDIAEYDHDNPNEASPPDRLANGQVQDWLREMAASRLGCDSEHVGIDLPLTDYGLDSLAAIEVIHKIETEFGVAIPLADLLQGCSIRDLALEIAGERRSDNRHSVFTFSTERPPEYPLSIGQQALWFLYQLAPSSSAYNIGGAIRIRSELDISVVRRILTSLAARHRALRTTFHSVDGTPVQRVHDRSEVSLSEYDATKWTESEVSLRMAEEAERPFQLDKGPLFRAVLFKVGEREHILELVFNHIIADFWSLAILASEWGALYEAISEGSQAELSPLSADYSDYVRFENRRLGGEDDAKLFDYWREQLAGDLPALDLPITKPRPAIQTHVGASHKFILSEETTLGLRAAAARHRTTLYVTLLAAYEALLYRYCGQSDFVVGSVAANRTRPEFARVFGYFTNLLPIRADLTGLPGYDELIERTRERVLGALDHQDYPFARLVDRLQPVRDPSRPPLCQAAFVMQRANPSEQEGFESLAIGSAGIQMMLGGLSVEPVAMERQIAPFELTLMAAEHEGCIYAAMQYNSDLFDASAVERMAGEMKVLLESALAEPDRSVAFLPMLSEADRALVLSEWNATNRDYAENRCLHQLFEDQVERTPDAVATVFGEQWLTYSVLNVRANQLASHLISIGVEPESLVGICVERSAAMIEGLLGILKAGGAYVPLDPSYPSQRLAFMLADGGIQVLLTQQKLASLVSGTTAKVMLLDVDGAETSSMSAVNARSRVSDNNLAYVIYTSGSTGKPKGVAIEHSSSVTLVRWAQDQYERRELASVIASTSICFDLSVFEIFVPLASGGMVIVVPNALSLPETAAADQASLINTVPSAIAELVRGRQIPVSIRTVNLAGEPLQKRLVDELYQFESIERVYNLYGPSEDTTYSTFALIEKNETESPSIGAPITNSQVYLLSEWQEPVSIGLQGLLYIGGDGLARGYVNRPELTAERFVPDPFGAGAGRRLYFTGDLARYRQRGAIEFIGRADQQIKLRGYRIELGEIEAALSTCASLREAAVMVREDAPGERRLIAYIVPAADAESVTADVRAHLKSRLPDYMIPSIFMTLASLPLTPNGKINRRALPAPEDERRDLGQAFSAPANSTEKKLAEIWSEVLRVERIGINDNFFEVGGDSILALQIIAKAKKAGIMFSPLELLQHQSIGELAALVIKRSVIATDAGSTSALLSLLPSQSQLLDEAVYSSMTCDRWIALRLRRRVTPDVLQRALDHLLSAHDALRLRFVRTAEGWKQQAVQECRASLNQIDLSMVPVSRREEFIESEILAGQQSLDASSAPIFRAIFFDSGDDEPGTLVLLMHSLTSDDVSLQIMLDDLQEAIGSLMESKQPVSSKTSASFTQWLEKSQQSELLGDGLASQGSNIAASHRPWPGELSGISHALSLSVEETRILIYEALAEYRATLDELVLAAMIGSLCRWAGAESISAEAATSLREAFGNSPDFIRTVGPLTDIKSLVFTPGSSPTSVELILAAKEQMRSLPQRALSQTWWLTVEAPDRNGSGVWFFGLHFRNAFNAAAHDQDWFTIEDGWSDRPAHAFGWRSRPVEVAVGMLGSRLTITMAWGESLDSRAVEQWASTFLETLRGFTSEIDSAAAVIPSDFPLAGLDQNKLRKLSALLGSTALSESKPESHRDENH